MTSYQVISSRLYAFKPGDIVTDLDLIDAGVSVAKSLTIGAIMEEVRSTKALKKYDKTINDETE